MRAILIALLVGFMAILAPIVILLLGGILYVTWPVIILLFILIAPGLIIGVAVGKKDSSKKEKKGSD